MSLDSLDDEVFMAMNDVGFPASKVLDGIEAALADYPGALVIVTHDDSMLDSMHRVVSLVDGKIR